MSARKYTEAQRLEFMVLVDRGGPVTDRGDNARDRWAQ